MKKFLPWAALLILVAAAFLAPRKGHDDMPLTPYLTHVGFTGSMLPTLKGGEVVLVNPVPIADVRVGDVVVARWEARGLNVIHRVLRINVIRGEIVLTTKGDNNVDADAFKVTQKDFRGRAEIPK